MVIFHSYVNVYQRVKEQFNMKQSAKRCKKMTVKPGKHLRLRIFLFDVAMLGFHDDSRVCKYASKNKTHTHTYKIIENCIETRWKQALKSRMTLFIAR